MKSMSIAAVCVAALALSACGGGSQISGESVKPGTAPVTTQSTVESIKDKSMCELAQESGANYNTTNCFRITSSGYYLSYILERQDNSGAARIVEGSRSLHKWTIQDGKLVTTNTRAFTQDGDTATTSTTDFSMLPLKLAKDPVEGSVLQFGLPKGPKDCVTVKAAHFANDRQYCAIDISKVSQVTPGTNNTQSFSWDDLTGGQGALTPAARASVEALRQAFDSQALVNDSTDK